MTTRTTIVAACLAAVALPAAGCRPPRAGGAPGSSPPPGAAVAARDTVFETMVEASATAEPIEQATLSTRLMGQVLEVLVQEGDRVARGAILLRIDARDVAARHGQVDAQLAQAAAVRDEAALMAGRLRALYADSAAPKAQLDAAEAALARATAAMDQARAAAAEVDAMGDYAVIRAPFAGTVTRRFVDRGAFAAPGAPLIKIENGTRLRISATAAPETVAGLSRGAALDASIAGVPARAIVEGVVPAPSGVTYVVNAILDNAAGRFLPHSAAVLFLPTGRHPGLVVPLAAVREDGDLATVRLLTPRGAELAWVRLGRTIGADVEVLAGLTAGDSVLVAPAPLEGR